jgi:hypothetical protein
MAAQRLFKVLGENGKPCNSGKGKWYLPRGKRPGRWMPIIDELVPCHSGYHLCRARDLLMWLNSTIYEAEARGTQIVCSSKVVVAQARLLKSLNWNESIARLFACDCTARALARTNKFDARSVQAVIVVRRYARGLATQKELAAARAAARTAARDAQDAWDAGDIRDAAGAARVAGAAYAAGAAWAAGAAGAAAWEAGDAERRWQVKRLLQYLDGKPIRDLALPEGSG